MLGQYADDAHIYSMFDQTSIDSIFTVLERFKSMSGFQVNYDKTTILRIGSLAQSDQSLISQRTVAWTKELINVLGIYVANDTKQCDELNYQVIIHKAKTTLNQWTNRRSSLIGKILVVNTLVASLFVYKMSVLTGLKKAMMKEIKKLITEYIWNGATPKISYDMLTLEKHQGGLKLVDLIIKKQSIKSYLGADSVQRFKAQQHCVRKFKPNNGSPILGLQLVSRGRSNNHSRSILERGCNVLVPGQKKN